MNSTTTQSESPLPTLTEVIEIIEREAERAGPLPLAPEAMALEDVDEASLIGATRPSAPVRPHRSLHDMLTQALLELLEPRLEAWLEEHIEASARAIARDLRAELPVLLRQALDEARPGVKPPR